jgi:hypothetical protein
MEVQSTSRETFRAHGVVIASPPRRVGPTPKTSADNTLNFQQHYRQPAAPAAAAASKPEPMRSVSQTYGNRHAHSLDSDIAFRLHLFPHVLSSS